MGHFDYSIDRDDAIASVDDAWLEFARANRAPELTRDFVVGQPLWRFIAGDETQLLYRDLFQQVRTRSKAIELPFRCDSPDRFRFMQLTIAPGPDDSIQLRGVLVREQERPALSILDRAFPRTRTTLPICSLCKKIYVFEARWVELEDAIRQLELFDSRSLPALRHSVCDACASAGRRTPGGAAAA